MAAIARVTRIFTKGYAEILLQDEARSCDAQCGACPCKGDECLVITPEGDRFVAQCREKAQRGDIVEVRPAQPQENKLARIVYLMPVVSLLLGIFLGRALGQSLPDQIVTGVILGAMTFMIAWIMGRKVRMARLMRYEVVRICKEGERG